MKGKITRLFDSERGVSPVIGVILMVAITVILAAVIGFFVLDLGSSTQETPQASFTIQDGTIVHSSGDVVDGENLGVSVVSGSGSVTDNTGTTDVSAGTSIGTLTGTGTLQVTWSSDGQSATLANIEFDVTSP